MITHVVQLDSKDSFNCDRALKPVLINYEKSQLYWVRLPVALLVKDLEPWYSERTRKQPAEEQDEKQCVSIKKIIGSGTNVGTESIVIGMMTIDIRDGLQN